VTSVVARTLVMAMTAAHAPTSAILATGPLPDRIVIPP
jgi:hypothetical protein